MLDCLTHATHRYKSQISKSCLEAFDEAARLFIHYITWSAGEELRKTKRQTMGVEDVLNGIEEADYGEFLDHLRNYASELQAGKRKKAEAPDA
jgi:predicted transcriptional regulator